MARRLAGMHEIERCRRAFMTLHTGERIYYRVAPGIRHIKGGGGMHMEPAVMITPEDPTLAKSKTASGLYPVRALWFVTPEGEVVK